MTTSRRGWAFEYGTLWACDMAGGLPAPVVPRAEVVFGEVRAERAAPLARAMGARDPEPALLRLGRGRRCFAAWLGDRVVAYGWVSHGGECVGEMEREVRMPEDDGYLWDFVTLPDHRGRGIYSALLSYALSALRGEGRRRAWIGASLANKPSIRGFANAGFQPIITIRYVRLLGLRCSWAASYPTAPATLVAAARRMFTAEGERAIGPLIVGFSSWRPSAEQCP